MSDHPLAQESSGLRIIHSEKMKWKWVCSAVLLISGFEKKNEVMAKRIGNDNETGGERGGGKTAWAWDFFTVKDYTFRKKIPECGEQKQHLMRNGGREGDKTEGGKKEKPVNKFKLCVL